MVEQALPKISEETEITRSNYFPLKIANWWGEVIKKSTDTKTKKIAGFLGTTGIVALPVFIDGKIAIAAAETLAVLGGATVGEKLPPSGVIGFLKKKKAIGHVRKEEEVPLEEMVSLLSRFPDVIKREEVESWPREKMGEESHEHPTRYYFMKAILEGNKDNPAKVVEDFMQAQMLAQERRNSLEYMRKEALRKGIDIGLWVGAIVGATNIVSFGLGYQSQAGILGLADDALLVGVLGFSFVKQKIKSFFSNS